MENLQLVVIVDERMRSSFYRFGTCMLKKQKFEGHYFVPELLGRCETGFPSAGAKPHEMIAKHLHARNVSQRTSYEAMLLHL